MSTQPDPDRTDGDYVYITRTSRRNKLYHSDRGCRFLPASPTRRRRGPLEQAGYRECKNCADGDGIDPHGPQDWSAYLAASNAEADD